MEETDCITLHQWSIGLSLEARMWSPTTFRRDRWQQLVHSVAPATFDAAALQAHAAGVPSSEDFIVDSTHLEARANLKSPQPQDTSPPRPADRERRSRDVKSQRRTATGTRERRAAALLLAAHQRGTVEADQNCDARRFVRALRAQGLTPHVATTRRHSAIDRRTTGHAAYAENQ